MLKKISKIQAFRIIIQIIFLFFLPGLFTLTFDGIKQTYLMILKGNFNFDQLLIHLTEAFAVIPITVLLGRFFCGWFCAFGTFNDFIYIISNKIFKIKFRINAKLDSVLKYLKYLVLLFIVFIIWTSGTAIFSTFSPWEAFAQIDNLPYAIFKYSAGFILLALIAVGDMFVERFFCRYLCPLGAVFSVISKIRIFKIDKPTSKCGKCRLCTGKCSMGIELYKNEQVRSGECINCFKCIEACPRKNPQACICNEKLSPALAGAVAITAFAGLYSVSNMLGAYTNTNNAAITSAGNTPVISADGNYSSGSSDNGSNNTNSSNQAIGNSGSSDSSQQANTNSGSANSSQQTLYKDGTYIGVGYGHRPGLQVSVTIKSNKITDVQILSNRETPRYTSEPFSIVPQEIIQSQSDNVDAVSGATESSDGIMMAVEDALSQAKNG